jgi:CMP-N,N'-diacetyllegionaminic acid synthase
MKKIAMIPVRLGSKRIPKKNLRMIGGKPLISYIVESAIESNIFDEIYINSESLEFESIAKKYGIKFYQRPEHLSTDSATNDDFVEDFMNNVEGDVLIQLLATSPFITSNEIKDFTETMLDKDLDTQILVKNEQIECVFENTPINFDNMGQTLPSQMLKPIKVYACGIMGWKYDKFLSNMEKFKSGYHGGDGKTDFFTIKGYSTIDVDNEEDFLLAEAILNAKKMTITPTYYITSNEEHSENDVPSILHKDGVMNNNFDEENREITNIVNLISSKDETVSWSHRLVNSESNSATLISQLPGEGNRKHYHRDWNEWWYILDGEWIFEIEGEEKVIKKNDLVFIPKGKVHRITATGDKPAIRLAVSRQDVDHIYV